VTSPGRRRVAGDPEMHGIAGLEGLTAARFDDDRRRAAP
jgi:hypothetical protein